MKKRLIKIVGLISALLMCISLCGCTFEADNTGGNNQPGVNSQMVTPSNLPNSLTQSSGIVFTQDTVVRENPPMELTEAANKVKGSAVMIMTETDTSIAAGSGVIIDVNDGISNQDTIFYILTCAHVCEEGATIKVYLPDQNFRYNEDDDFVFSGVIGGKKADVQNNAITLVGADKDSDIAVLKLNIADSNITASDITEATVMPSEYSVNYGEAVFAIGNPSGVLPGTITTGVVSYINRITTVEEIGQMTLLQLDMTTHPGSSGGALFNMYGELIGITSSGNIEYTGLNFAIPHKINVDEGKIDNGFINIAKQLIGTAVANDFENYGYVSGRKVKLGVTIGEDNAGNVIVAEIAENSMAHVNGLALNDIIETITLYKEGETSGAKTQIESLSDFSTVMESAKIGDKVVIAVSRVVRSFSSSYRTTVEKEFTMSQYYFCNTGVYPQA